MTVNPLPPQAYTKDTLQRAYSWLLTQPVSVKELAHDQNILVSLYLKAQREGDAALETPSIQNFKQELKSLANMMGDFQSPQQISQTTKVAIPPAMTQQVSQPAPRATITQAATENLTSGFDHNTLAAIAQLREAFNLSSDQEAIRALVALGIKQFRKSGL
jgi:hypothetical protein